MRTRSNQFSWYTMAIGLAKAVLFGVISMVQPASEASGQSASTDIVPYKGWQRNLKLANDEVEVIITLEVGPRILSYRRLDGKNVLKEYDEQLGKAGEKEWMIRGGHRLWVSPEDPARTYIPDNSAVNHEIVGPGHIRVSLAPDSAFGLEKIMEIKLAPTGSKLEIEHTIRNHKDQPTELAIWALSVMRPGGVEIIPLPPKAPHPGSADNATAETFAPAFPLVSWSYTDFTDPRYHFGADAILLRQDSNRSATKIGLGHRLGVVGYLNDGDLFIKRFAYVPGALYPDFGSSYETFTNEDMLELESLSPLVPLEPGASVSHKETWELEQIKEATKADDAEGLIKALRPRLVRQ